MDDIEVNQIVLVKILSTLGARCDVAGNGQEALELFEQSEGDPFDLILMDVQMPVLDGYSATRAIRAGGQRLCGRRAGRHRRGHERPRGQAHSNG